MILIKPRSTDYFSHRQFQNWLLVEWMRLYRHSQSVVTNRNNAIGSDCHVDKVSGADHHLIYTSVYDFIDQMVQPTLVGRADIHAGAHAHGLQSLELANATHIVIRGCHCETSSQQAEDP